MEVRHEPPSADTMFRLRAPLHIGFPDGQAVKVDDWSLRALYSRDLADRPLDGLMLSIPFQGVGVYFPVELEKGEGEHEYLFRNLTGRERETLALFYRNLLSGRMTATAEMITALDTPVDLVPMEETEVERRIAESRLPPRKSRLVVNLIWYLALFLLVAGFLGSVIWGRITRVPALSAHVSAPAGAILAPVTGFVREIPAAPGAGVARGDILVRLDDQEALRLLAEAETAQAEAQQQLAAAEARLQAHLAQSATAREVFRGGAERFDQGISVNTGDFHDIRLRLEGEIATLTAELDRLAARLEGHRERAEATTLTAPGAGVVMQHLVRPFDMVRPGDALLRFERDAPRGITAYLAPGTVERIWPGMRAEVRFLRDGEEQRLDGTVAELSVLGTGADLVIVARVVLDGLTTDESRLLLPEDLPVAVLLRPEPLRRWLP